jgi:hypothetical protein
MSQEHHAGVRLIGKREGIPLPLRPVIGGVYPTYPDVFEWDPLFFGHEMERVISGRMADRLNEILFEMPVADPFDLCGDHRFVNSTLKRTIVKIAADIASEAENRSTDCEVCAGLIDPRLGEEEN